MNRIRKGDQVLVITGKNKGQRGECCVLQATRIRLQRESGQASTPSRIRRPTRPGGIVEREASIHLSNVQLFNPATNKGERVGTKTLEDGRKVRVFRSSGEVVDA
jgi:LSU ribosomal protein L24P